MGHTQALKCCQGRLLLNMNVTASAFYSALPVEKFIQEAMKVADISRLPPHLRSKGSKIIGKLRVLAHSHMFFCSR